MKSTYFPAPIADEMIRALLDNRKTVTRRAVKPQQLRVLDSPYHKEHPETPDKVLLEKLCEPPCRYMVRTLRLVKRSNEKPYQSILGR